MCDRHEFFFEFDKAFNHQLIEKFEASPDHPLAPDVAPALTGVYALCFQGQLVYAGKALNTTLARRPPSTSARLPVAATSRFQRCPVGS
jgi:hypothetical protein